MSARRHSWLTGWCRFVWQALCCSAPTSSFFTYIAELKGHSRTPWTLSFHRQDPNLLVSGCLSGELRLWNLRQRACEKQAVLGQDRVTSVSFHPVLNLVAAACGRDLYLWDVKDEQAPKKKLETTIGFLCCKLSSSYWHVCSKERISIHAHVLCLCLCLCEHPPQKLSLDTHVRSLRVSWSLLLWQCTSIQTANGCSRVKWDH
jgi:WD40 repeat protein